MGAKAFHNLRVGHRAMRDCPKCGERELARLRRRFWMRLLPASRFYKCNCCSAKFLVVCKRPVRLPQGC